jgi:hypothetical protein
MYTSKGTVYPKISNMPDAPEKYRTKSDQHLKIDRYSSMLDKHMLKTRPKQCLASITRTAAWMWKAMERLAICSAFG